MISDDNSSLDPRITTFHGVINSDRYGDGYALGYTIRNSLSVIQFIDIQQINFTCKFLDLSQGGKVNVSGTE